MTRKTKITIALIFAGASFSISMLYLGGMCGYLWPIGVACGMGSGFVLGVSVRDLVENKIHD